jgi:hypothetical protein
VDVDPARLEGPTGDAVDEVRREQLREQRDDVDSHGAARRWR